MWKWVVLTLVAIVLISVAVVTLWVEREAAFRKERLIAEGRAKALILYHPSRDAHFSDDLTMALARGFQEQNFAVERWTMTSQTPPDPTGFALIAVVSNTFYGAPDWPTQAYLERARLAEQPVIAIIAGSGTTQRAQLSLAKMIKATGARLLEIRPLWTTRPNDPARASGSNRQIAMDIAQAMAREAGRQVLMSGGVAERVPARNTTDEKPYQ